MFWFLSFIIIFFLGIQIIGVILSEPGHQGPITDHFNGRHFFTPNGRPAKGFPDVLKWAITRKQGPWTVQNINGFRVKPIEKVEVGNLRVTFVNHSTFLIQTDKLNILTDPVWSERTSPVQWLGPKRMRPPGIRLEDLPPIDLVLLSHNHYDHFDLSTIRFLHQRHHPKFIITLGMGAHFNKLLLLNFEELDWWQEVKINDYFKIHAVPAQHFSGRGLIDRDKTLWCGYVINRPSGNIYFAGDTGYQQELFQQIGQRVGPMKLSILPIGAFRPQWFMSPIHCSPEEALQIHFDVKSEKSIASHFGTFPLADDGMDEPTHELKNSIAKRPADFFILKEGVAVDF